MARRHARRSRRRNRRRGQRHRDRYSVALGFILFFLVAAVSSAGGYWYWKARQAYVALDGVTLCPVDGPRAITVFLLDRTDPINAIQKEDLRNQIEAIVMDIPRYGKLEFYTVEPIEGRPLRPRYAMCNPGRGEEIDPTIANPRRVEEMWRSGYRVPLEEALDDIIEFGSASSSPIMESIQSVAVTEFGPGKRSDATLRLVLASDLLQHTRGYSHYRGIEDFERFRASPYYRKVRADLRGVEIELLYLQRDKQIELGARKHVTFWEDYFADQGALPARLHSVKG
jgi:hypothetical protein